MLKEECHTCGQKIPSNWEKTIYDASLFSLQEQEKLLKAFMAETGLKPSECILVEEMVPNSENPGLILRHFYVRRVI